MFTENEVVFVKRLTSGDPNWKFSGAEGKVIKVANAYDRPESDPSRGLSDAITVLFKEFDGVNDITQTFDEWDLGVDRRSGENSNAAKKFVLQRKPTWFSRLRGKK